MWTVIAGALLVLVVVVVLLAFFSRSSQKAEAGLSACETTGGQCVEKDTCGKNMQGGTISPFECENEETEECCLGMKKALA